MKTTATPTAAPITHTPSKHSRFLAAWWGSWIGDALAMPAHWYYKLDLLERDYGHIHEYTAPKNPHPDSILWRSRYEADNEKDNILHAQAQYWGKPGIHFHQHLQAGENTLNLKIAELLAQSLVEGNGYDPNQFVERYIEWMLTPGTHNDTYIEEAHRAFFKNYGRGKPVEKCGIEDSHIGGLATLTPLILYYHNDLEAAKHHVRQHLSLTHKGATSTKAGELYTEVIYYCLQGQDMEQILFETIGRNNYQALSFPYHRWIENHTDDREVVGHAVSNACYLEDALPATLYLALKYQNAFELALTQNTALGGDNCHRGAVLGSILGAQNGCEIIPAPWVTNLTNYNRYDQLGDQLWEQVN